MQIKRFEATDMTAALNLVKETFGPDAVILSARSIQRGTGLFGLIRKAGVEVTAAIDSQKKMAPRETEVRQPVLTSGLSVAASADSEGGKPVAVARSYPSYRRNGLLHVKRSTPPPTPAATATGLRRILAAHGVREDVIQDLIQRLPVPEAMPTMTQTQVLTAALSEAIQAKGISAPPSPPPRVIALVGPTGVGKSTAAARIAAQQVEALGGRIGLISSDFRKIGADAEIQLYAQIIGIPVACAWNPEAMRQAVARMQDRAMVIIDTPGISPGHQGELAALSEMLSIAGAQVHLLLSAAAKPGDLENSLDRFSSLDIERLLFTRLDETESHGALLNLPTARRIPLSWINFGPQIPEALRPAAAPSLARLLIDPVETMEQWRSRSAWVVAGPSASSVRSAAPASAIQSPAGRTSTVYVANRGSGIFHKSECKLAKAIKEANRITFDSCRAAKAQNFLACQNCRPGGIPPRPADPEGLDHPQPPAGRLEIPRPSSNKGNPL